MDAMDSIKAAVTATTASTEAVKQLAIDTLEESAKISFAAMTYLNEVGIRQLRSASEVRDFVAARRFAAESLSLSGELTKVMLDTCKAWLTMAVVTRDRMADILASGPLGAVTRAATREGPEGTPRVAA